VGEEAGKGCGLWSGENDKTLYSAKHEEQHTYSLAIGVRLNHLSNWWRVFGKPMRSGKRALVTYPRSISKYSRLP